MKYSPYLIIALLLFLLWNRSEPKTSHVANYKTDTVYIDRAIEVVKVSAPIKPKTIIVYRTDTTARKEAEKADIITGVEVKNNNIAISKITPLGITSVSNYPVPDFSELKIDAGGQVEVKKKRGRKFKNILIFSAGFALGAMIAK